VKNHCLAQQFKGKLLPCAIFEDFFDIIEKYLKKIGHGKKGKLMKSIHSDYYGISESAVKLFISLCPQCAEGKRETQRVK
jgi:hypothetical protein